MSSTLCNTAIGYADLNWCVLPLYSICDGRCTCGAVDCASPGKHPHARYAPHGVKDATQDSKLIRGWLTDSSIVNLGVRTGEVSGIIVIDVDDRHGGFESLKQVGPLPGTAVVQTGNGQHLYFRWPEGAGPVYSSAGKLGPGLDVRANGGYVVAPPSIHASGAQYKWLIDPRAGLAELPPCILDKLIKVPSWTMAEPIGDAIPVGKRDSTLTSLAGTMRRRGMSPKAILAALREENQRCEEPLPDKDLVRIARSIGSKPSASSDNGVTSSDPTGRELVTVCLADVEPRPVAWFWRNRFPLGKLSMLVGNPGLGKSFLSLFMAAKVSAGGYWPESNGSVDPLFAVPQGRVVILTAEDDLEDTVRPRLDDMGADCRNILAVSGIRTDNQGLGHVDLRRDIERLERMIECVGNVKLVIIDPISAYLGDVDSHKNAEVRGMLALLSKLAEHHGAVVLGVSHLNKNQSTSAVTRVQGSLAFTAAPRAVWLVTQDSDDEKRRLLVPVKTNICTDPTSMAFRVVDGTLIFERDLLKLNCNDLLTENQGNNPDGSAVAQAKTWLKDLLSDGRVRSTEVFEMAKREGVAKRTLTRAKAALDIQSQKEGIGPAASWYWKLADRGKSTTLILLASLALFGYFGPRTEGRQAFFKGCQWPSSKNAKIKLIIGLIDQRTPRAPGDSEIAREVYVQPRKLCDLALRDYGWSHEETPSDVASSPELVSASRDTNVLSLRV